MTKILKQLHIDPGKIVYSHFAYCGCLLCLNGSLVRVGVYDLYSIC